MPKNYELAEAYADELIKDIGGNTFNPSNLPKADETELQASARRAEITKARGDISDMCGLGAECFSLLREKEVCVRGKLTAGTNLLILRECAHLLDVFEHLGFVSHFRMLAY